MKNLKLRQLALVLAALFNFTFLIFNSSASNITFSRQLPGGGAANPSVTIYTEGGSMFTYGSNQVAGSLTVPLTNGITTVSNLQGLRFVVTFSDISSSFVMPVPNDTKTYSFNDLALRGLTLSSPELHLKAGTNVFITTNYQDGIAELNVSSFPTNIPASIVTGLNYVPLTNNTPTITYTNAFIVYDSLGVARLTLEAGNDSLNNANGNAIFNATTGGTYISDPSGTIQIQIISTNIAFNEDATFTSNVTAATFTGNGALLTGLNASQVSGTFPTNQLPANLAALAANNGANLNNLTAANLIGTAPLSGALTNPSLASLGVGPIYPTNINSIQYLVFADNTADESAGNDNPGWSFLFPGIGSPGVYLPLQGTNYVPGSTPFSLLSNGQTNYIIDPYAANISVGPANSPININDGAFALFMNGEPFAIGTIIGGMQNDYVYMSNGFIHWGYTTNVEYDPRSNNFANDIFQIDEIHRNIVVTNAAAFAVAANNISISGNGQINAVSASAGVSMPSAPGTFTNLTVTQSTSASTLSTLINFGGFQMSGRNGCLFWCVNGVPFFRFDTPQFLSFANMSFFGQPLIVGGTNSTDSSTPLQVIGNETVSGTLIAASGFNSTANVTNAMTTGGYTNLTAAYQVVEGFTGTSCYQSNRNTGINWSIGTITAPIPIFLGSNECVIGSSCASPKIKTL